MIKRLLVALGVTCLCYIVLYSYLRDEIIAIQRATAKTAWHTEWVIDSLRFEGQRLSSTGYRWTDADLDRFMRSDDWWPVGERPGYDPNRVYSPQADSLKWRLMHFTGEPPEKK